MRYLDVLLLVLVGNYSFAQSIYASAQGGYQVIQQAEQPESFVIHTYHLIQHPSFWRKESLKFNAASHFDFSLGHEFAQYFGYEISFGYIKPIDAHDNGGLTYRTLSANFWRLNPKLILHVEKGNWSFNSKLGFSWSRGKINYRLTMGEEEQTVLNYEYKGGESFGFTGSFGVERKIAKRFCLFAELSGVSQSYSPDSGVMTEYVINHQDQFEVNDFSTFESEIEFGEVSEEKWMGPADDNDNRPQKLYRRNFSLSGYGIHLGLKITLWTKKYAANKLQKDIEP